jgi:DNA-binding TFAR19-related protein (PDSD5 family)
LLQKFYKREGHCRVPAANEEDGVNLGRWVGTQRSRKKSLTQDQTKRLDSLGFSWDPFADQWEQAFAALQKFHRREGHCRVQANRKESGLSLGIWVSRQRGQKKSLTPDRLKRLNDLGFSWDPVTELWEQGFAALQKFHMREGHCRVPYGHEEDGLNLGVWVGSQRWNKNNLTPDRLNRLNSLSFVLDPYVELWEQGFAALQKFHKREGHCRVQAKFKENGIKLGIWVGVQRKKKDGLSPDRLRRLDALNFSWDPVSEFWEQGFAALQEFHKREGHGRVPYGWTEDGFNLGVWVSSQRNKKKGELSPERLKRLNSLGFSWDRFTEIWEEGFTALKKFHKREGHCRVAQNHKEEKLALGAWVSSQRTKKDSLTPDRLRRLNALGFSWDRFAEQWEQGFAALQKFQKREGHCRVQTKCKEEGLKLGVWVSSQRGNREGLTRDQIKRLNALGFVWKA